MVLRASRSAWLGRRFLLLAVTLANVTRSGSSHVRCNGQPNDCMHNEVDESSLFGVSVRGASLLHRRMTREEKVQVHVQQSETKPIVDRAPLDYPIELGIAYIFLIGYLFRTVFVSLGLPAAVGAIVSGFAFSFIFQRDIFYARDTLQELAFFLVLLTAGLEIKIADLRFHIFVLAWFPATLELLAIATYATYIMSFNFVEGLVLGTVLVAIGDGLVIPKMKELMRLFPDHPLPRLVFVWAPLEASFALTCFGTLVGLSAPAASPDTDMRLCVLANVLRIVATLVAGACLGAAAGWLVPRRMQLQYNGQPLFTGAAVESFLMVLAVALVAYGMGEKTTTGSDLLPMGFSAGSVFQPELMVIVTGTIFSACADSYVRHQVEDVMGGVWVFGQLILFGMIGSKTSPTILHQLPQVLPIMFVGLSARFAGVLLAMRATIKARGAQTSDWLCDAMFCFLSTIPRATIQGALGSVPVTQRFFYGFPHRHFAQEFIFTAARLYIFTMSIFGMILLNFFGPRLLQATIERPDKCDLESEDGVAHWAPSDDRVEADCALDVVAAHYHVEAKVLRDFLKRNSGTCGNSCDDLVASLGSPMHRGRSSSPRKTSARDFSEDDLRRKESHLSLSQFEASGSLFATDDRNASKSDSATNWRT